MSKPKSQWQPIGTAPKDGTQFLAAWRSGAGDHDYDACSYREGVFATRLGYGCRVVFTHWMPIPPLPEEER